ncbi:hypothetical protein, partial [Cryptobacterium curtum]
SPSGAGHSPSNYYLIQVKTCDELSSYLPTYKRKTAMIQATKRKGATEADPLLLFASVQLTGEHQILSSAVEHLFIGGWTTSMTHWHGSNK